MGFLAASAMYDEQMHSYILYYIFDAQEENK